MESDNNNDKDNVNVTMIIIHRQPTLGNNPDDGGRR